jgi:pimeloyl-ACP methyl ester carboxylesterase
VQHELSFEWVHLSYQEQGRFAETYGFAGSQGAVNLEGILIRPVAVASDTLLIFMHPASTLHLLPIPRALARAGMHVLCAASRYAKNDTALILENVVLDLGAFVRYAKAQLGYRKVVLEGWSGGGALALLYQSQAEHPTIEDTPAGDPVAIREAGLPACDGLIIHAAHASRARLLLEWIDPSVRTELDPDDRDPHLDLYSSANPNQPPYDAEFVARYRDAQLLRMRRITTWVKETLVQLARRGSGEVERGFVTHLTLADPRFLDPAIDPNGRKPGWCYLGRPETANSGPVGLARFSTLRSWLSQWSIDDSRGDGPACASKVSVPLLVIENGADDGVPQPHTGSIFFAAASSDKSMAVVEGGTHYYTEQPEQLAFATNLISDWLASRRLIA